MMSAVSIVMLGSSWLACGGGDDAIDDGIESLDTAVDALLLCNSDYDLGSALGSPVATGSNKNTGNNFTPTCTGGQGEDYAYTWSAPFNATFKISTAGSSFDTVLYVLGSNCSALACNNDVNSSTDLTSAVTVNLSQNQKIVIDVDGYYSGGDFKLNIVSLTPTCTINGVTYLDGALNPSNHCQYCNASASTTTWSNGSQILYQSFCKYGVCQGGPCGGQACQGDSPCAAVCKNGAPVCDQWAPNPN